MEDFLKENQGKNLSKKIKNHKYHEIAFPEKILTKKFHSKNLRKRKTRKRWNS